MAMTHQSDSPAGGRVCVQVLISGRVQGVGYRYNTQKKAMALGLVGWVRNLPDGRVEAVVEGDRAQVTSLVEWFHSGPPAAVVEAVSSEGQPLQHFEGFEIRRSPGQS